MRDTHHTAAHSCQGAAEISRVRGWHAVKRAAPLLCAGLLAAAGLCGCGKPAAQLVLTKPLLQDAVITRTFPAQVKSGRRMEIRAQMRGYLEVMNAREGQNLKEGEPMFRILQHAPEVAMKRVEAEGQPDTAVIPAPFDGRMSLLRKQAGSPVREGDLLTTLSDNREMGVDFNVPEAQFTELAARSPAEEPRSVGLVLANGRMFDQPGRVKLEKTEVNPQTGTLPQHAVFPNPKDLLRHGESGSIQMKETLKNALLVPLQATFEITEHRYVHVVGKDGVIRQKRITVTNELKDFLVVTGGVSADDTIVLKGTTQVHDGDTAGNAVVEEPAQAYAHLKLPAE